MESRRQQLLDILKKHDISVPAGADTCVNQYHPPFAPSWWVLDAQSWELLHDADDKDAARASPYPLRCSCESSSKAFRSCFLAVCSRSSELHCSVRVSVSLCLLCIGSWRCSVQIRSDCSCRAI